MRAALFSLFFFFFFLPVAQQPNRALSASFLRLLRHTQLDIHIYPLRLLRRLQRPLPTQHTYTQETHINIINGIRTRNLSSQADSDLLLRLHGHQYSLLSLTVRVKFTRRLKQCPWLWSASMSWMYFIVTSPDCGYKTGIRGLQAVSVWIPQWS
jgi:hypothetical protein